MPRTTEKTREHTQADKKVPEEKAGKARDVASRKQASRSEVTRTPTGKGKQEIKSLNEHEEQPGQTLVTRSHEVIQKWAEERDAAPATVEGTEHEGRAGVLRFDFPGYGGRSLKHIPWDEWFATFDARELEFIYQEHKRDGKQSNFFRLNNPNREDA